MKSWWWREWDRFWQMLGGQGYLATVIAVFLMGLLLGWGIAGHSIKPEPINLGSIADWVAALGALIAAASTVAIAVLGHRAIAKRDRVATDLAISTLRAAVVADVEVCVRVSRNWSALTSDRMVSLARDLYIHQIPKLDADVSGLPPDILMKFQAARSILPSIIKAARNLENNGGEHRRKYLAFRFERLGVNLRSVVDFVAQNQVHRPWKDWKPRIDVGQYSKAIMARFHAETDGVSDQNSGSG
ncbi:hypothetical protein [Stenotrophomonas maltophilia]|uniref:hypothetical protein n=1 Tax=Stenotrophomonas maltophilia TaxID=40324 RepID=UPI0039F6F487